MKLFESANNKKRILQDLEKFKEWVTIDESYDKDWTKNTIFNLDDILIIDEKFSNKKINIYGLYNLIHDTKKYTIIPSEYEKLIKLIQEVANNNNLLILLEKIFPKNDNDFWYIGKEPDDYCWLIGKKGNDYKFVLPKNIFNYPYRYILDKGSYNKVWKCWSNKMQKWTILKNMNSLDIEVINIMQKYNDIFSKIYYYNQNKNIIIQEYLIPYETYPNNVLLKKVKKQKLKLLNTLGYYSYDQEKKTKNNLFVDINDLNWGYEILGWKDKEQTNPILGALKNFDPVYKIKIEL